MILNEPERFVPIFPFLKAVDVDLSLLAEETSLEPSVSWESA